MTKTRKKLPLREPLYLRPWTYNKLCYLSSQYKMPMHSLTAGWIEQCVDISYKAHLELEEQDVPVKATTSPHNTWLASLIDVIKELF